MKPSKRIFTYIETDPEVIKELPYMDFDELPGFFFENFGIDKSFLENLDFIAIKGGDFSQSFLYFAGTFWVATTDADEEVVGVYSPTEDLSIKFF